MLIPSTFEAGHLIQMLIYHLGGGKKVGSFPHERIPQDRIQLYITEGNHDTMKKPGKDGLTRHWILEIHLRDTERGFQGFVEQLLTVG